MHSQNMGPFTTPTSHTRGRSHIRPSSHSQEDPSPTNPTTQIWVMTARAMGPQVHEALKSPLRTGSVIAMDIEIDTVIENFKCLLEDDLVHAACN